jgi:TolB-like protein
MGSILMYVGRSEESIAYYEKAIRFDPFSTVYFGFLGFSYFFSGQYQKAIGVCKRAKDSRPQDFGVQLCLASAYSAAGHEKEAHAVASEILKMNPKFSLEWFSKRVRRRFKKQADIELYISSLRKAGIPDKPPLPLPNKPSIAVLAFDNLSGDLEQEYFSDGIAENIITALSKVSELFVIARNSSFTYKGKPVKVQQISRELGVRYVLEGSVQKSGDRVRITAQLIDAKSGQHVWAEKYDRDLSDIFEIQDEITKNIVTGMRLKLTEGDQARLFAKQTKNLDVYLKISQAVSLSRDGTKESIIRFGQIAQEIIAMEPDNQVGYRLKGWYHHWLASFGDSPQEVRPKGARYG